jgi:RHS repeat-associated protein
MPTAITPTSQYAGYYVHSRSGLNLTRTRAYSASLGRFISRDPIEEYGGINLYGYVRGNPISLSDPSGLFMMCGGWPPKRPPWWPPFLPWPGDAPGPQGTPPTGHPGGPQGNPPIGHPGGPQGNPPLINVPGPQGNPPLINVPAPGDVHSGFHPNTTITGGGGDTGAGAGPTGGNTTGSGSGTIPPAWIDIPGGPGFSAPDYGNRTGGNVTGPSGPLPTFGPVSPAPVDLGTTTVTK